MSGTRDRGGEQSDRRTVLRQLAGGAAALVCGAGLARAQSSEDPLQSLIDQTQVRYFGQNFDSTSRTIHMPKASLPTLSPSTVATTEQAIPQYEAIVARGGWPTRPPTERRRLGNGHPR